MCIVDDQITLIGGHNIADEYFATRLNVSFGNFDVAGSPQKFPKLGRDDTNSVAAPARLSSPVSPLQREKGGLDHRQVKEYKMLLLTRFASFCCLTAFAAMALADDAFVYPKNDQTMEQQQKDKSECYTWAKRETGFDPQEAPRTETPPPSQSSGADGSVVRGAARGALLARLLTTTPVRARPQEPPLVAMRRRDRQRQEQQNYAQWEHQEAAKYAEKRNRYDRAYKVCLEARDYSVS